MRASRLLLLACVVLAPVLFFALDLGSFLTIETLQQRRADFGVLYAGHPWQVRGAFFVLCLATASLSLPGASLLMVAGGAVFGFFWGLLLSSFAFALGATVSFRMARWLLRDWVQVRFATQFDEINAGVERAGGLYLVSLRLIPVVPFFLINLTMGLTTLRTATFYAATQLGMLASTAVYVNAGTQLASLHSLSDGVSPGVLASLALMGALPLLVRRVLRHWERRRALGRWRGSRPRRFDRNLIVIGAGAGGLVAANIAAALKAKVTLVEARAMGGDCLNTGCVPSKALIRSARAAMQLRQSSDYGLQAENVTVDFKAVMQRVQGVIASIAPHDSVERYTQLGVDVVLGHARITTPWSVEITLPDGRLQTLSTRAIVIAAGARPRVPDLPGVDDTGYLTSDTLWTHLATQDSLPKRWVVLGGGPIGCELSQAFARLGAEVTLVEMTPRLMQREDTDVSAAAQLALAADGVQVLTSHQALRCERTGEARVLVVSHHGLEVRMPFDRLLVATGRVARLSGYGLEELGIAVDQKLVTDDTLQTLYPTIYAAGDVTGSEPFTHLAAHQAWYATFNALFGDFKRLRVDHTALPRATFIDPEIARVGLNEQEAQAQGVAYEVTRFELEDLDRALIEGDCAGFVKVLTAPGKDRILGVTIVGAHASEMLAEYTLAMRHGLGLNKILATVHSYPTLSEANRQAAGVWRRAHAPDALLRWAARFHAWRRG